MAQSEVLSYSKLNIAVNYYLIKRIWDKKYKGLKGFYALLEYSETTYNKVVKTGSLPNKNIIEKLHGMIGLSDDVLMGHRIIDIGITLEEWRSIFCSWYPQTDWTEGKDLEVTNAPSRTEINKKLYNLFKRPETINDVEIRVLFSYFNNNRKMTEKEIIIETKRIRENQLLENALKVQKKLEPLIPQLESVTWSSVNELYINHIRLKKEKKNATVKALTDYEKYKKALENQMQLLQAVEIYHKQIIKEREMKRKASDD